MDHLIKRDEILYKILFNLVNKKHWGFRRKYIQFLIYNIEKLKISTGYICNELCNHASNFGFIYIRLSILSYFMLTLTGQQYGQFNFTCI